MDNPKKAWGFVSLWLLLIYLASGRPVLAQPVLTEVMFRPLDSDGEYAEFFNPGPDSLDPVSIRFRDGYSTTSLVHVAGPSKVPPGSYALLIDKDYFEAGSPQQYEQLIPPGIPVFKTSNASIGNGLGNTSDLLCILSVPAGDTLSSISWNSTVPAGFSIERRHPAGPVRQVFPGINWIQSVITHGSPGQSYAGEIPVLSDASIKAITQESDTSGFIIIQNSGIIDATPVTASLQTHSGELLFQSAALRIPAGGELIQPVEIRRLPAGVYQLTGLISGDTGNDANDRSVVNWSVEAVAARDICIDSVRFSGWVQVGRPVLVTVTLKNKGWLPVESGTVYFEPEREPVLSQSMEKLQPGEKRTLSFRWIPGEAGLLVFSVRWEGRDDVFENNSLDGIVQSDKAWPLTDLRLTEVMANPDGSDYGNEFIELTNLHPTDSIPVSIISFRIGSVTIKVAPVSPASQRVGPGQSLVVFCESWFSMSDRLYPDLEKTTACVIGKSEPAFSLTNRSGSIQVFADTVISDSFNWARDAGDGRSWERAAVSYPHQNRYWLSSAELNGSPGEWNPPFLPEKTCRWIKKPTIQQVTNGISVAGKVQFTGLDTLHHVFTKGIWSYRYLSDSRPVEFSEADISGEIAFGDSLEAGLPFIPATPGTYQLIFQVSSEGVVLAGDTLSVSLPLMSGSLKLTEVYAGAGDFPPFIELQNESTHSLFPDDLKIGWKAGSKSSLLPSAIPLWQGGRVILVKKEDPVPAGVNGQVIWCASFPVFSAGSGWFALFNEKGIAIDSVFLPVGWSRSGMSYERVDSLGFSAWRASRWAGGSPAQPNTWPIRIQDVSLSGPAKADAFPDEPINLNLTLRNTGLSAAENMVVNGWFLMGENRVDSLGILNAPGRLEPGDSVMVPFTFHAEESGTCRFVADYPEDERPSSNVIDIPVQFHSGTGMVVNEILSDPIKLSDGTNGSDWLELMNRGNRVISMKDWSVQDGAGNRVSIRENHALAPGAYLVLADDSTFFSYWNTDTLTSRVVILSDRLDLNAGEDSVFLMDEWGYRIESLGYRSDWHHPDLESTTGISMERRRPDLPASVPGNWNSSGDRTGGTPGRINSVVPDLQKPASGRLVAFPNPFFPDDGESCEISWRLPSGVYSADIRVFDITGRELDAVQQVGPVTETGTAFWNGRHQGRRVPAGPYVVLQSVRNRLTGDRTTRKLVVVVGCRL